MTDQKVDSIDAQQASGNADKSQDKVAYESFRKSVEAEKKARERANELEKRLKEIEARDQQANENKLKEQNEWKALAEAKEKALLETTAKLTELETTILDSVKLNAFNKHLGGRIKDDAYYQFVDTNQIAYNPDTKMVDEESVKSVVAEFVKRHASLVEFKGGRMPNEAAKTTHFTGKKPEEMTKDELANHIKELHKLGKL